MDTKKSVPVFRFFTNFFSIYLHYYYLQFFNNNFGEKTKTGTEIAVTLVAVGLNPVPVFMLKWNTNIVIIALLLVAVGL